MSLQTLTASIATTGVLSLISFFPTPQAALDAIFPSRTAEEVTTISGQPSTPPEPFIINRNPATDDCGAFLKGAASADRAGCDPTKTDYSSSFTDRTDLPRPSVDLIAARYCQLRWTEAVHASTGEIDFSVSDCLNEIIEVANEP